MKLLWAVYRHEDFYRSQSNIEYGMLHAFRTMVHISVQVIILADRGFGRAEMAKECSLFTISRIMLLRQLPHLKYLLKGLKDEILLQNWG